MAKKNKGEPAKPSSQKLAIAGVLLTAATLALGIYNANAGRAAREAEAKQKEIELEANANAAADRAFDSLGGNDFTLWVHVEPTDRANMAKMEEARRIIENEVLLKSPRHVRGRELRAIHLAKTGRIQEATEALQQLTSENPGYPRGWCNYGTALLAPLQSQDKPDPSALNVARAAVERCLALEPKYAIGRNLEGHIESMSGHFEAAIIAYRSAIDLQPGYAPAYVNLANVLHELGRHDDEATAAREAVSRDGNLPNAHFANGRSLLDQGRKRDAASAFAKAEELGFKIAVSD